MYTFKTRRPQEKCTWERAIKNETITGRPRGTPLYLKNHTIAKFDLYFFFFFFFFFFFVFFFFFFFLSPPRWSSGKTSVSRAEDPGFEFRLRRDFFRGRVIPVTYKLEPQWLPCRAPGVIGSAPGLVGPMSVYCDWVRWKVGSAAFISVWQHAKIVCADPSLRYTRMLGRTNIYFFFFCVHQPLRLDSPSLCKVQGISTKTRTCARVPACRPKVGLYHTR